MISLVRSGAPGRVGGFTLVEVLVVIVLMAMVASMAVALLGGNQQQRELENEAKRIHGLLRMASDEAVLSNTEIGFSIDNEAYEFLVYDDENQKWGGGKQSFMRSRNLPDWINVSFKREGEPINLPTSSNEEQAVPQMMLLSSGEVTPFEITMQIRNDEEARFLIYSDGIEPITLLMPGESRQ